MIGLMGLAAGQAITGTVTAVGKNLIGLGTMFTVELRPGDTLATVNAPRRTMVVDVPLNDTRALLREPPEGVIETEAAMIVSRRGHDRP